MSGQASIREIVLAQGDFFHVTTAGAWAEIQTSGLDPRRAFQVNGGIYCLGEFAERPCVFLCTKARLNDAYRMKAGDPDFIDPVVIKVNAHCIADLTIEIDITHREIMRAVDRRDRAEVALFSEILEKFGYIACFENVPPKCLSLVDYTEPDT